MREREREKKEEGGRSKSSEPTKPIIVLGTSGRTLRLLWKDEGRGGKKKREEERRGGKKRRDEMNDSIIMKRNETEKERDREKDRKKEGREEERLTRSWK